MNVDTTNPMETLLEVADGADLIEVLALRGWGDGLPLVAPTPTAG